jgi:hypothetical protein
MEPCRIQIVGISRGNTAMTTATKQRRTWLEAVLGTASEMTAHGSQKMAMATTATPALPDKVLAAIDTVRVGTLTKCRDSMKDETSLVTGAAETRTEVVEEVETRDVAIIRTMAAVMQEAARERMIAAEVAEEAKAEVGATGTVLPVIRAWTIMVLVLVDMMELAILDREALVQAAETSS